MNQNRYILYARKSTDVEDKQVLSIEAQMTELRKYARDNGFCVVDKLIEKRTAKCPGRPAFNKMLARIQNGEADAILAWHPDRLARNSIDGGQIIYLTDNGVIKDLAFPTFWFDTTPQGKFMLNMAFSQSKYYVDNLSENVKRGLRQKVRRGEFPGIAPFGYYNDTRTHTIKIYNKEAELLVAIFDIYAKGQSTFQDISDYLFARGIKTAGGRRYPKDKIKIILKNPFYYGHFRYGGEIHEGKHAPLISKKLFDEVQVVIKRRSHPTKGLTEPQAFCGLLRCPCGMMITAENKTKHQKNGNIHRYVYYRCSRKNKQVRCVEPSVRSELLDRQLSDLLGGFALPLAWHKSVCSRIEHDLAAEKATFGKQIGVLQTEITALSGKLQRLLDSFLDGIIEKDEYTAKKAEIMSKKKSLEEQVGDLTIGKSEWVEPLRNWLDKAVSICEVAKSDDQNAKKSLLLEIFGLNLLLQNKTVRARNGGARGQTEENLWFLLKNLNQKIRSESGNLEKSLFVESIYSNARTYFNR